ncbi:MAG: Hint domain-containing protein, partial [Rhodobacteraceae bacterium]|nr:Hint domain-containing protein [Paracoccaceae bacterium]
GQAPPEGTPLYYLQGQSSYTGNGQAAPIPDLTTTPGTAICFLRGTRITTPDGPRAIEDLAEGDLVTTLDHGPQPIRWIGS